MRQTAFAQRSQETQYFAHRDMDYYLKWIMGRQLYEGSDAEECGVAVAQITDGDAISWYRAWHSMALQLEAAAQLYLQQGDAAEARKAYLRACTYYRAALFLMAPQIAGFQTYCQNMRTCFQSAAALSEPPLEHVAVPFQDKWLYGYFVKVDDTEQPRPTLIVIGGIETFAEDCYFMIGQTGRQRGYHVLVVDLPGQGITPEQGLYFEARMERSVQAVIDYAVQRADIDADRLALFGFSWGGHIVFKGAQQDARIQALIANPPMPYVFRAALAQQKGTKRSDPIAQLVFAQIAWRMGLTLSLNPRNLARRAAKAYDYFRHGNADPSKLQCPTLCLAGEGEAPITLQIARRCFEQLPHPQKKLVIFTKAEGGEAHCQIDNLALPNGVMFDWLDTVFA